MNNNLTPLRLSNYSNEHHLNECFANESGEPFNLFSYKPNFKDSMGFFLNADSDKVLQNRNPKTDFLDDNNNRNRLIRCWNIGHSTVLIQIKDKFILTDPIFDACASPVPGTILRSTPAACYLKELPPIDYVLLSHSHYDHLNKDSVILLQKKNPNCLFLCPLELGKRFLSKWRINFCEFDWREYIEIKENTNTNQNPDQNLSENENSNENESGENRFSKEVDMMKENGIRLTCMPARHGTNRTGFDGNQTLWCSWFIQYQNNTEQVSIYFPGDTAIGPHFKEVYEYNRKRPIDLFIAPIGPQLPVEMMRNVHIDGKEAYDMSKEMKSVVVVPIHHGVFPLGVRPEITDLELMKRCWNEDAGELICWKIGGRIDFNGEKFTTTDGDQTFNE